MKRIIRVHAKGLKSRDFDYDTHNYSSGDDLVIYEIINDTRINVCHISKLAIG